MSPLIGVGKMDDGIMSEATNSRKKFRAIQVDDETIEMLHSMADRLETKFGFRPTLGQTLRCLLNENRDIKDKV